jgi:hypothetical protein
MALDFSAMMTALADAGEPAADAAPEPAPSPGADADDADDGPLRLRRPRLDATALLADVQEHKRRIETNAKLKLRKDKKIEKSKGYLDKLGAVEKFRKTQTVKGPGGKYRHH